MDMIDEVQSIFFFCGKQFEIIVILSIPPGFYTELIFIRILYTRPVYAPS